MELNEKTVRSILTEQREEYVRHLGAFAEDLGFKIQAVAEGHEVLRQEMAEGHAALRQEMADRFQDAKLDMEQIRLGMEMMRS